MTRHARERYAERAMGKKDPGETARFAASHAEKIDGDVRKMAQHGAILYAGKPTAGGNQKNEVAYVLSGQWVLVCDPAEKKVVTLYKVDLGVGEDLNREYVSRYVALIGQAKEAAARESLEIDRETEEALVRIRENEAVAKECRATAKALEELNTGYRAVVSAVPERKRVAEGQVRSLVAALVGKKAF